MNPIWANLGQAEKERDMALIILEEKLSQVSTLFRKCYLENGRGALLLYAKSVVDGLSLRKIKSRDRETTLLI